MESYKIPIEFAFIVFPFIAFILTIPFLIHQYRRYGAIPLLKSLCFYSLILYLICAYFLVMLPLPTIEEVANMTGPKTQLNLFQFVKDIAVTVNFNIKSVGDFINIFKSSTVYIVVFNLILTLPFGVYLRYYFKKKWYHTLIYSFLLSLFFELTQLSGLYGIYPRPYRLFDVDDLLINTLGGLLGHTITPIFTKFLPTRDELEAISYKKGQKVSLLRRFVSWVIDIFVLSILFIIFKILLMGTSFANASMLITLTLYYTAIPMFNSGKTVGKKVLRLKIASNEHNAAWYQILIRNFLLVYIILYPSIWIKMLNLPTDVNSRLWLIIIICQTINILYYIYSILKKENIFLYEKLSNTKNVSTIGEAYEKYLKLEEEEEQVAQSKKKTKGTNCKNK